MPVIPNPPSHLNPAPWQPPAHPTKAELLAQAQRVMDGFNFPSIDSYEEMEILIDMLHQLGDGL